MKNDELDLIPQMMEQGKLTKKEAVMKILEHIYKNLGRFDLLDLEEDDLSDFLMEMLPKFEGLLDRYDKSLGPLGAYIYYSIPGVRMSWKKRKWENAASNIATKRELKSVYEYELQDSSRIDLDKMDAKLKVKDSVGTSSDEPLVFRRVLDRRLNCLVPKEVFYKKRAAFVLALKSAWYIDDSSIGKVSDYCGFSKERFIEAMEKIKSDLLERSEKRAVIEANRDKAWAYVCKYREMLSKMAPSTPMYDLYKKKLDYQLNSWKKKTKLLQSCQMVLSPRNKELAKLLKIKPYRVSMILSYARKMVASGESFLAES